jgi:hypothetical protein
MKTSFIISMIAFLLFGTVKILQITAQEIDPSNPYFTGGMYLLLITAVGFLFNTYRTDTREMINGLKDANEKLSDSIKHHSDNNERQTEKMVDAINKLSDKLK